jgi:hypothetical protein
MKVKYFKGGLGVKMVLFIILSIGLRANAADCVLFQKVKGDYSHSLRVGCPGADPNVGLKLGYMYNDEKLYSVKLRIIDDLGNSQEVQLNRPPGGFSVLNDHSDWVKSQLKKRNITTYKDATIVAFSTESENPYLFMDVEGKQLLPKTAFDVAGEFCTPTEAPVILRIVPPGFAECKGLTPELCAMKVICVEKNGNGKIVRNIPERQAYCSSNGLSGCPDARECLRDKSIIISKPRSFRELFGIEENNDLKSTQKTSGSVK